MDRNDFYNDLKWCDDCSSYVRYLMSMEHSYCAQCGTKVRLFNDEDWQAFSEADGASKLKRDGHTGKRGAETA